MTPEQIRDSLDQDTLRRGLFARMELALQSGEKIVEEARMKFAEGVLSSGFSIIPSQHLQDNQIVVSEGVYRAVKEIIKR